MTVSHRINHIPGFMLSSAPWRESSLAVEVFTRDYGRLSLIARSARKRQSELRGVLVPFVPLSLSWYGSEALKTLHRAEWIGGWPQPQARALLSAMYANELVLKLTAREDPHPEIYHALAALQRHLATEPASNLALRRFEWALLQSLGLAPDIRRDAAGAAINATARYQMRPEHEPTPWPFPYEPAEGIAISGAALIALADAESVPEAALLRDLLRLTRLLLDFRLPEGIASRQVLQQLSALTPLKRGLAHG